MEKIKPRLIRIGSSAQKLYNLEYKRSELIKECAKEWNKLASKHFGFDPEESIWKRAIPQVLFDILESFERSSSQLAAQAYLEHYGFTIILPAKNPNE